MRLARRGVALVVGQELGAPGEVAAGNESCLVGLLRIPQGPAIMLWNQIFACVIGLGLRLLQYCPPWPAIALLLLASACLFGLWPPLVLLALASTC